MIKTRTEETARAFASERGLLFGFSLFDGAWYVGSFVQLRAIGVVEPKAPAAQ